MIEYIQLENFRGFEKIELFDLKPITLISGKNNAGKSSILEGIFLLFDHLAPESFMKINHFRGLPIGTDPVNLWESLFNNMDTKKNLTISMSFDNDSMKLRYNRDDSFVPSFAADDNIPMEEINQFLSSAKSTYTLKFEFEKNMNHYKETGHFVASPKGMLRNINSKGMVNGIEPMPHVQFINSSVVSTDGVIIEWFSKLELKGKKQEVINILKIVEPLISDITTIAMNGQIQLYAKMGKGLLPLKVAGDGLNRLLYIILAILLNPEAIILIDEIETGFHYSAYSRLWETIAVAAKENKCQIIATTHSYECIISAIEGIEKAEASEDFCFFRVNKKGTDSFAYRYSNDLLCTAIRTEMEVR